MELVPSSLRVTSGISAGVSMPVAGGAGRSAAANRTIVVPAGLVVPLAVTEPLLATHRFLALSKAMPRGPLNAVDEITTAGGRLFVPVIASCAAVNTSTVLLS